MSSLFNLSLIPCYVRACWSNFSVEFFVPCSAFVASLLWNSSDLCCFSQLCWVFFVLLILNQLVQIPFHLQTFICSWVAVEKLAGAVLHKLRLNYTQWSTGSQPSNDIVKCRMTACLLKLPNTQKKLKCALLGLPFAIRMCVSCAVVIRFLWNIIWQSFGDTGFWRIMLTSSLADLIFAPSYAASVCNVWWTLWRGKTTHPLQKAHYATNWLV